MITNKKTFFLGIFIFTIPFLGFPSFWKTLFVAFSGLLLLALSIRLSIPKKPFRPKAKKEKVTPVYVENIPVYDRRQSARRTNPLRNKENPNKEIE